MASMILYRMSKTSPQRRGNGVDILSTTKARKSKVYNQKERKSLFSENLKERWKIGKNRDARRNRLKRFGDTLQCLARINTSIVKWNLDSSNTVALYSLNDDAMEIILKYLSYNDLLSLSRASSELLHRVQNYALHYVSSNFRMEKLDMILNSPLLTFEEIMFRNRLIRDHGPQKSTSLLALKYVKQYGKLLKRSSITTAIVVDRRSQFQKQRYIIREKYPPLDRDVLRLKQICGLHFEKCFKKVPIGQYQISIHFQLGGDLRRNGRPRRWNNNCRTLLSVDEENENNNPQKLCRVSIEPHYWKQIQNDTFDNNLLDGNGFVVREDDCFSTQTKNWFFLVLKPFTVNKETTLIFKWSDVETTEWKDSGLWKEEMCWDFVQIQAVK